MSSYLMRTVSRVSLTICFGVSVCAAAGETRGFSRKGVVVA